MPTMARGWMNSALERFSFTASSMAAMMAFGSGSPRPRKYGAIGKPLGRKRQPINTPVELNRNRRHPEQNG